MKHSYIIALLVIATIAVAGCGGSAPSSNTNQTPPVTSPPSNALTMAVVAQHNSSQSCYTAINGSVYDLTSWINQHPGGSNNILSICGKDGSSAFNEQHGGQGRPEQTLAGFRIGALQ